MNGKLADAYLVPGRLGGLFGQAHARDARISVCAAGDIRVVDRAIGESGEPIANPSRRSSMRPMRRLMASIGGRCACSRRFCVSPKLESEHAQRILGVDVQIAGRKAIFLIRATDGTRLELSGLTRKADLFEREST